MSKNHVDMPGRNYEEAIRLMQRATTVPKNTKINYYDDVSRLSSLHNPSNAHIEHPSPISAIQVPQTMVLLF